MILNKLVVLVVLVILILLVLTNRAVQGLGLGVEPTSKPRIEVKSQTFSINDSLQPAFNTVQKTVNGSKLQGK